MTTFSGNETVNNVVRLSTSSTGTLYTVPANKYAKVYVEKVALAASTSFSIGELTWAASGNFTLSSFLKVSSSSILGNIEPVGDIVLYTGQTIINTNGIATRITIIEFAIP